MQCAAPHKSTDMNSIENVWGWLKKLTVVPQQPKQHAQHHLNDITPYTLRRLYHRMPQRIRLFVSYVWLSYQTLSFDIIGINWDQHFNKRFFFFLGIVNP